MAFGSWADAGIAHDKVMIATMAMRIIVSFARILPANPKRSAHALVGVPLVVA